MNEDRATRYHRLTRRARIASLLLVGGALTVVVASGGGHWLGWLAEGSVVPIRVADVFRLPLTAAVAAALLTGGLEAVSLPAAAYIGLVLQRRYGLSLQSTAEWWRDQAKASLIGLVIAMFAAILVYASLRQFGVLAWLAAGLGITFCGALLTAIAPILIFPLFYRFELLPPGDLPDRLRGLAARAGTPVLGVYSWSLGDKSRTANAALVGIGPTRRILLSDTLIDRYTADEIEVIIAHELAHHVHGDIWKGVAIDALQVTVALLVGQTALMLGALRFGLRGVDDVAGMPLLVLAAGGWSIATAPLVLAMSRGHERRADRFALELTGKADAFVSAMRRLGAQNLADVEPPRVVEWLFHSHPSLTERIARARAWATGRPGGAADSMVTGP